MPKICWLETYLGNDLGCLWAQVCIQIDFRYLVLDLQIVVGSKRLGQSLRAPHSPNSRGGCAEVVKQSD